MSETIYRADETAATTEVDQSERYRLIADSQRRTAIRVLSERTDQMPLSELADAVARRDDESADPAAVRVRLHHVHLPKLAAAGLLQYDREDNRIARYAPVAALLP